MAGALQIVERDAPAEVGLRLSAHLKNAFHLAQTHRDSSGVTERLLQCARQRAGVYDPGKAAEIRDIGGSDIYMMLTDTKCRAAESWMRDILLSAQDRTWSASPTPIFDLPPEIKEGVVDTVMVEAMQVAQAGMAPDQQTIELRMEEVYEEVARRMKEVAREAADRMQIKIDDILVEAGWDDVYADIITDFCTYPFAVWEGPILRRKKVLEWGRGFKPVVKERVTETFRRHSPFDCFWSPNATNPGEGNFFIRMPGSRKMLADCIGQKGFNDAELEGAIDNYGASGFRVNVNGDSEQAQLHSRSTMANWSDDVIDIISCWASVSGGLLREWGMKDADIFREYEINAWLVGGYTVRCVVNPHPLGMRPIYKRSFHSVPGAFCGRALPEVMRDIQIMCNAAARALANNMGVASGPQVELYADRLPEGENVSEMYPWKIWQTTSDRSGGGQRALNFFQPDMKAAELMNVFQFFLRQADEVSGIPNYVYGSTAVGGAGRTSSGLAMLMENAAKGIKQAILSLDRGSNQMIMRLHEHLMLTSSDHTIKGDVRIIPSGVVATLMKDQVRVRRQEFLAATANPLDAQVLTPPRRAVLLREQAKDLNVDVEDLVPSKEEVEEDIRRREEMQMQAQMQMMTQQQQQQQPPPAG